MSDEILIINGPHVNKEPIGHLTDPDGNKVLIWSKDGPELAAAYMAAVGPVPAPPNLGKGGSLVVSGFDSRGYISGYEYDPSGDKVNEALVAAYTAKLSAWNERAKAISKAIDLIVGK